MGCKCSQQEKSGESSSIPIYIPSQTTNNDNFKDICVNESCENNYGSCSPKSPEKKTETPKYRYASNSLEAKSELKRKEEVRSIFYYYFKLLIERGLSYTTKYLQSDSMKYFIPVEDKDKWILNARDILFTGKFDLKQFIIDKKIAHGGFGDIYLLHLKESPQYYFALKKLDFYTEIDKETNMTLIMNEIVIHSRLIHPFIISFIYHSEMPSNEEKNIENIRNECNSTCILMELGVGGNLLEYLKNNNPLSEDFIRFYTAEVLIALNYIHEQGYVYKDLKADNILFGVDGHIRLCDFGLSTELFRNKFIYKMHGTRAYLSPELIQRKACDGKSIDYWAFGCLLFEMFTNIIPFVNESNGNGNKNSQNSLDSRQLQRNQQNNNNNSNNREEVDQQQQEEAEKERKERHKILYKKICDSKLEYPKQMFLLHTNAVDLISKLLNKNYEKRIKTFEEIKSHSFFSSIDWENIHKQTPPYKYILFYYIIDLFLI